MVIYQQHKTTLFFNHSFHHIQEQHPEHPLSALHQHFVSSLHTSDRFGCIIQHGTKLFPCLFHPHSFGLGRFCIGINEWTQTKAAWYTALRRCCFNESCVGSKFLSCWLQWAKRYHLFTSYLVDVTWYIKQTNPSIVFISLSITSAVGLNTVLLNFQSNVSSFTMFSRQFFFHNLKKKHLITPTQALK